MEASIPFQEGLALGQSLDVTNRVFKAFQQGPLLVPDDVKAVKFQVNLTTAQYSIVNSYTDVCDVLQIPYAYALKVKANLIIDDVLTSCLKETEDQNTLSIIFRINYLQQKQYLPQSVGLNRDVLHPPAHDGDQARTATEGAQGDSKSDSDKVSATHWIKALEIGNELIVICRISTDDQDEYSSVFRKLTEKLGSFRGLLEPPQIAGLEEFAKKLDKKLKKKHYSEIMKLSIEYCTYSDLQYCPANLTDMVLLIKEFIQKCEAWTDLNKQIQPNVFKSGAMVLRKGTTIPQERGTIGKLTDFFQGNTPEERPRYFGVSYHSSEVDGEDGDSIEVVACGSDSVHLMRLILESFENEDLDVNSFNMIDYPATCQNKLNRLHKYLTNNINAIDVLQAFMESGFLISINEKHVQEAKDLLKESFETQVNMAERIDKLDFVALPTDEELKSLQDSEKSHFVKEFIENVSTKLPQGPDLDLLIIGKTGHGKSSTGNSILGQPKFEALDKSQSVTTMCGVGWTLVDGRTIKVVDTPGVCDTREESDKSSIDVTIHAVSDAISQCPEGFHALLLVIRYGQRFTLEERKAIGMLKCIFGEDIIKEHCVCVVTYGDDFKAKNKGKKTFEEWCRGESGFLKDIFEECQYRCVLFDNQSEDLMVKKRQVIAMVSQIDSLASKGTRYTNDLFEFALNERNKAIEEENAPEVNEGVMRDIQLVLDHLDKVVKGSASDEIKTYESDLENLKCTVDNLKNRVNSLEGNGMEVLVDTVFSLAQAIHAQNDEQAHMTSVDHSDVEVSVDEAQESSHQTQPKSEIQGNLGTDLRPLQENLQEVKNQMEPKAQTVNNKVADKVEEKVKNDKNCFPSTSLVTLRDGSQLTMADLKVGDEVLARNRKGRLVYDEVYMFGHRDVKAVSYFVVLETKFQQVIVSQDHMVYCYRNGTEVCLPARLIKEGDELFTISSGGLEKAPILRISSEKRLGLYAPFTNTGTLIVDGALMSCYVDVLPPAKAHNLLEPMRKLYKVSPLALEFINGSKRGNSVPTWAKFYLKWKQIL